MTSAIRTVLLAVCKRTHTLKSCPAHKLLEFLIFLLSLSRETHHQSCTDMYSGHSLPYATDKLVCLFLINMTTHIRQDIRTDMLKSNIKVFAHILPTAHHIQQFHREISRISIVQANPLHTLYLTDTINQFCNALLAVDILAVVCQFLSNNLEFLHTLCHEILHFILNLLHRS